MLHRRRLLLATLFALLFGTPYAQGQDMTVAEREVWAMEEAYQTFWNELNDLDGYMELWHENYLGWLGGYKTPINKAGIREFFRRGIIEGWTTTNLKNEGVERFGDYAVTYYSISGYRGSARRGDDGDWWRVTHYWTKEAGKWQIIGGMSAPLDL
jgi:hypothetical protein